MIDSCRPLWEMTSSVMERALPAILLVLVTSVTFAQGIQLSAEQQQMLNQLPPAQRQQAVDAIRQLQSQQASSTQQSINEPLVSAGSPPAADSIDQILSDLEPRAEGRSRLVLNFTPSKSLSAAQRRSLAQDAALQDLTGSRLFILDDSGVLTLPGLEPIPLLGLNEADINRRLGA